jgi:NAD(P)-dependent dehydrogenase (short-subunit alcohol dehydrogenase family)
MRSIRQLIDLNGRKALVSGGAGHIGQVVCDTLIELGAAVSVIDVAAASSNVVTSHICDLADEKLTRETVRKVIGAMGGLDTLIHCAGYVGTSSLPGWAVPFEQQTAEAWDAAMRVNVSSAFVMAQQARQALADSGHGSIVLFSSIYGMVGPDLALYEGTTMANPAAYGVSKAGLLQFTRYLATILRPRIRVNSITPGGVLRNQPNAFVERYVQKTPLGRMATEEDFKGAIAYLCSDLSMYVTGHNLVVDGGWTAW